MRTCKCFIISLLIPGLFSCKQKDARLNNSKTDTSAFIMPGEDRVALNRVIVPGISIGPVSINEAAVNVYKKLGKPDGGDAAMGKSVSVWYAHHDTASYKTQIFFSRDMGNDETSRVKQIRVTSPEYKVNGNVHPGAPVDKALALYQLSETAQFSEGDSTFRIYDDIKQGIAFEANSKGVCTGVVVHEPGQAITVAYSAFYPNLKRK